MPQTGTFKYETEKGNIFRVRMDDRAAVNAARGPEPSAGTTEEIILNVGKNLRQQGLRPRCALYGRTVGNGANPDLGYTVTGKAYKRIPVLTKAHAATVGTGASETITIGTTTFSFIRVIAEEVN